MSSKKTYRNAHLYFIRTRMYNLIIYCLNWKQLMYFERRMNCHIHKMEYYSATKKGQTAAT